MRCRSAHCGIDGRGCETALYTSVYPIGPLVSLSGPPPLLIPHLHMLLEQGSQSVADPKIGRKLGNVFFLFYYFLALYFYVAAPCSSEYDSCHVKMESQGVQPFFFFFFFWLSKVIRRANGNANIGVIWAGSCKEQAAAEPRALKYVEGMHNVLRN